MGRLHAPLPSGRCAVVSRHLTTVDARGRERVLGFVDDAAHDVARRARARRSRRRPARTGSTPCRGRRGVFSSPPRCSALAATAFDICSGNLLSSSGCSSMCCVHSLRMARSVLPVKPRLITVSSSCEPQERFLVAAHRARFGRRDEARAEPHAVGAERERGREAAPVEDAARRDDRHPIADRVDDLRHERHGRDRAGVAARFGALRDHEVAARLRPRRSRAAPCRTCSRRARCRRAGSSMTSRGTPRPATKSDAPPASTTCARPRPCGRAARRAGRHRRACRSRLRTCAHLLVELFGRHRRRAERADAAGIGDGGDERVRRKRRPCRRASPDARCRACPSVVCMGPRSWTLQCPLGVGGREQPARRRDHGQRLRPADDAGRDRRARRFRRALRGADRVRSPHARRHVRVRPYARPSAACG